ncbi:MAG: NTP transferase domain-containing protein [Clostridia bacterium]|nr:NTP transferase domain-containing protein [Clostridia bacterium]
MKAVVMAGGEGSRLRPLTCDIPKPMARLCGRPAIEYIFDLLIRHGCTKAAVTLRYLSGTITRRYESGHYGRMELEFFEENDPLGTAGSVKNAALGYAEDFVVISGDALCDFNLTEAMDFHRQNRSDITVISKRVEDPREYGLITSDRYGKITGFVEKPSWRQVYTDMANTGIYIINPSVLPLIPSGRSFDFANDLFPVMLKNQSRLMVYEANGYWCDIGDTGAFIRCQRDMLNGRVRCDMGGSENGVFGELPDGDFEIIPPVHIGKNVTIRDGAVIGPNSVIDDGCSIGYGAKIKRSVMLPYSAASDNSNLSGAVLCQSATAGQGAQIFEGAVIGSHAVVGKNAQVLPGVRIWPHKRVQSERRQSDNMQYGASGRTVFDDEGICGESFREITPEYCARLGAVIGGIGKNSRIAVGGDFGRASHCFRMALTSGIMSSGSHALDFGDILLSQFNFSVGFSACDMGIYVKSDGMTRIILSEDGGLPVSRKTEREIEGKMNRGEAARGDWERVFFPIDMSGVSAIYKKELLNFCEGGLFGQAVNIKSTDEKSGALLRETLTELGCALDAEGAMSVHISSDGTGVVIHSGETGYIWQDKAMLMSLIPLMQSGRDVALPYDAPEAADILADRYGVRVLRYFSSSGDKRDQTARQLAKTQHFVRDGFFQIIAILNYMNTKCINLSEYYNMVPNFGVSRREIVIHSNLMSLLRSLGGINTGDGVIVRGSSDGRVLVRPDRNALKMQLIAESESMEAAEELCVEVGERIEELNVKEG